MATNDPSARRILPQDTQTRALSFSQPILGLRENQKNYVFVDEHNRHKRLKVMRACEGCRRRKIKCDAATTNTWPCSACIRLKLHCIPPTINYDQEFASGNMTYDPEKGSEFETSSGDGDEEYKQQLAMQQHMLDHGRSNSMQLPYAEAVGIYQTSPYLVQGDNHNNSLPVPLDGFHHYPVRGSEVYPEQIYVTPNNIPPGPSGQTPESWNSDQCSPDLIDALGELKIDETGIAPYISHQKRALAGAPPQEEWDDYIRNVPLPPPGPDMTVRIPPEFMPDDETAMQYFDIFFSEIHPYVPVIERSYFYHQWHTNPESISPLILEAIFACAGARSSDISQGAKWLALAAKHSDCFMDVPRLSTIQAMLLIMKARETSPKRGYYFRSWITIVTLVAMAKDLGLDEHSELHQAGEPCESSYHECIVKTRVWQTLFVVELMVGAPQGRTDMSVDPETVDLTVPVPRPGLNASELIISRDWVFMGRIVRNVRRMNDTYGRVKKKKDWGSDPRFVQLNPSFMAWTDDLPVDLQISYPPDGSSPFLRSHFVGNLHSYHNLSIIMLHRPQLACSDSFAVDGEWKRHMLLCYTSAKKLCRLQEAVLASFGLSGLLCMQRGIGFTVYAVLTCTVLHLVAITSPDPELNLDAQDFFTRHMRILEQCTTSWPMPEMQAQIDALREAFSADTTKPFTLKPTFPYNSPPLGTAHTNPSPQSLCTHYRNGSIVQHGTDVCSAAYGSQPISPPASAGLLGPRRESNTNGHAIHAMATGPQQPSPQVMPLSQDQITWNPSRIFDQWNTAFGTPQPAPLPHTPTALRIPVSNTSPPSRPYHNQLSTHTTTDLASPLEDTMQAAFQSIPSLTSLGSVTNPQTRHHRPPLPLAYSSSGASGVSSNLAHLTPTFVSPSMWQSSVAAVYEDGLKRRWDFEDSISGGDGGGKRRA